MTRYIDRLRERALAGLRELHESVDAVVFVDYPDHTNVGDSAIALGEFAFWEHDRIRVTAAYPGPLVPKSVFNSTTAIAFQGGGSFGGLYPPMDRLRLEFLRTLTPSSPFIQLPQSVHFTTDDLRAKYRDAMKNRMELRIGVRDADSERFLRDVGFVPVLLPDAVHVLGAIQGDAAQQRVVVLARTDAEAVRSRQDDALSSIETIDWNPGGLARRSIHRAKYQFGVPEFAKPILNKSPSQWRDVARRRLEKGVARLAVGEIIVTDRLHAMLLGLQLGRRVIAVDSATRKLSAYADTWLTDPGTPLEFADDFGAALAKARKAPLR